MKKSLSINWRNKVSVSVFFLGVIFILIGLGLPTSASPGRSLQYNFSQSQTQLTVIAESSQAIGATHWSYAGPLNSDSDCRSTTFSQLAENLKGQALIEKSNNNRSGKVKVAIQKSDNNKFYCFIAEGYAITRQIDYNPPVITLRPEVNRLSARDTNKGLNSPHNTVDTSSWRAAIFDVTQQGDDYGCNGSNQNLVFKPIIDIKHTGRWSWGSDSYFSYNAPEGSIHFLKEFFEGFRRAVYDGAETDSALIPFVSNELSELFTDNIHLCHRVADPRGNMAYQLMRFDLGGPAIKLVLDGRTIRASSVAVDLDETSWQYLKIDERIQTYSCEHMKRITNPTGSTAVAENVENGKWYCFSVLDDQGRSNIKLVKVDLGANTLETIGPTPIYRPDPQPTPEPTPEPEPEPIPEATPEVVPQRDPEPVSQPNSTPQNTQRSTVVNNEPPLQQDAGEQLNNLDNSDSNPVQQTVATSNTGGNNQNSPNFDGQLSRSSADGLQEGDIVWQTANIDTAVRGSGGGLEDDSSSLSNLLIIIGAGVFVLWVFTLFVTLKK